MTLTSEQAFEQLRDGFEQARERTGARECRLAVAGHRVAVSVAGGALAEALLRPVAHLGTASGGDEALRAMIFSAAAADAVARPGAQAGAPGKRLADDGDRFDDGMGAVRVTSADGRFFRYERGATAQWIDHQAGLVVCRFGPLAAMNQYERGRPLHSVLVSWLGPQDRWITHAGLVESDGTGILLPGRGGRGKTTATLACAAAGMNWAAEDVAIIEASAGVWTGHGVYSTAKLSARQISRIGGLGDHAERAEPGTDPDAKLLVHAGGALRGEAVASMPIGAIAIPTIDSGETRTERISGAEALRELINGTISITPHLERPALFEALAGLVASVPCHRLFMGPDPHRIPPVLARLGCANA